MFCIFNTSPDNGFPKTPRMANTKERERIAMANGDDGASDECIRHVAAESTADGPCSGPWNHSSKYTRKVIYKNKP